MKSASLILFHLLVFTGFAQAGPPKVITIQLRDYDNQLVAIRAITPSLEMNEFTPTQVMETLAPNEKSKKEMRRYWVTAVYRLAKQGGFANLSGADLGIQTRLVPMRVLQSGDIVVLVQEHY